MQFGKAISTNRWIVPNKLFLLQRIKAIVEGLRLLAAREETGGRYTIFTDSQAAMHRLLDGSRCPGQAQAIEGINISHAIGDRGSAVEVRWVPGHAGVEGNEAADLYAPGAAVMAKG